MLKLKKKVYNTVIDGIVFEGHNIIFAWNDVRVEMKVVYYDGTQWVTEPLENFVPAVQGVDY